MRFYLFISIFLVACSGAPAPSFENIQDPLVDSGVVQDSDSGIADSGARPDVSVPETCSVLSKLAACGNKECGSVWDGCTGTLNCGYCTSPSVCGGSGVPGSCGCTPVSKPVACGVKNCGLVSDGCSGTYDCGTCSSPQSCGGSGSAGVCGCTPLNPSLACTSAGASCGSIPDGCGGTINCGTCAGDTACGVVVANHCDSCPKDPVFVDCPSNAPVPRQCPNTSYTFPDCQPTVAAHGVTPPGQYCCTF
jgi:hypothetical protein